VPKKRRKRRVLKPAAEKPNGQAGRHVSKEVTDTIVRLMGMKPWDRDAVLAIVQRLCA
jgi:hypothetical protein